MLAPIACAALAASAREPLFSGGLPDATKVPLILDMDANYDDTLALAFLANHPTLDLKAVTVCANGFATAHGGPVNMQKLLGLLGRSDIPVSVGEDAGLSPITNFPPAWQIEIDQFYESQALPEPETPLSMFSSPQLIAKTLKESDTAVAVLVTGSATNLAIALRKEPELINRISVLYLMGSNYGGESNNVFCWQMNFMGAYGSCTENAGAAVPLFTAGSYPLNVTKMGYGPGSGMGECGVGESTMDCATMRPGCRGVNMCAAGLTEWNVFLDALAWHVVTRAVAEAKTPPELYAYTSKATETMGITKEDFEAGTAIEGIDPEVADFMMELQEAFLAAGEAKWWDASTVVSLGEIIAGEKTGLCTEWAHSTGFMVSQTWKEMVVGNEIGSMISARTGCASHTGREIARDPPEIAARNRSDSPL